MIKLRIPNAEVVELLSEKTYNFPKYSTQIMNLANQNSQGTRANVVGQMSELIQEFDGTSMEEWREWYLEKHPNAIDNATDKVYRMISFFKDVIIEIDKETVRDWVEELVIVKTYAGLKFQEAILKKIAMHFNKSYRLATPQEESVGIDGYIEDKPISIKPVTYKSKLGLSETIHSPIVFYDKRKSDIVIEFEDLNF